jgi:hypothetical protein
VLQNCIMILASPFFSASLNNFAPRQHRSPFLCSTSPGSCVDQNGSSYRQYRSGLLGFLKDSRAVLLPVTRAPRSHLRVDHESCSTEADIPGHQPPDIRLRIFTGAISHILDTFRNQQELFAGGPCMEHTSDNLQCALCHLRSFHGT